MINIDFSTFRWKNLLEYNMFSQHDPQIDFSKLLFYKFFMSLMQLDNMPSLFSTSNESLGNSNCFISGRPCCNIKVKTTTPERDLQPVNCQSAPEDSNTDTANSKGGRGKSKKWKKKRRKTLKGGAFL